MAIVSMISVTALRYAANGTYHTYRAGKFPKAIENWRGNACLTACSVPPVAYLSGRRS